MRGIVISTDHSAPHFLITRCSSGSVSLPAPSLPGLSWIPDQRDQALCSGCAHMLFCHIYSRQRRLKYSGKVTDLIGGLEIPGLRFICPYQVHSGQIGPLYIVDQNTVAGDRLEVCVKQDKRERQLQKRKNVFCIHFCSQ